MRGLLPSTTTSANFMFGLPTAAASLHPVEFLAGNGDPSYLWDSNMGNANRPDGAFGSNHGTEPSSRSTSSLDGGSPLDTAMNEQSWTQDLLQASSLFFADAKQSDRDFLASEPRSLPRQSVALNNLEQRNRPASGEIAALNVSRKFQHEPRSSPVSRTGSDGGDNSSPQSDQSPMVSTPQSFTSLSDPLPNVYRTKGASRNPDSLAETVKHSITGRAPPLPGIVCIDDAIRMTVEYPLRMLADTFRSPFIHPRLARACPKGMPQPIAEALACVGMKMHSEQPGLQFVCDVFQDQRDKLIKEIVRIIPPSS